jgi:hypothetical protein
MASRRRHARRTNSEAGWIVTLPSHDKQGTNSLLGVSVAWGYLFGFCLMAFVFVVLLPEAEGPSPWDPIAFRKAILGLFANFRILDELADMGLVRLTDVGSGLMDVDAGPLAVSNRRFGWAPFYVSLAFVSLALLLRGIRQRLLASHFGFPHPGTGQIASYFFGRGMNLFFPFGPGDLAVARSLDGGDGTSEAAAAVVFHNRMFELLGILVPLFIGLVYVGWGGAVTAAIWTVVLVAATVSLTQPLGWSSLASSKWNILGHVWAAFNGRALARALNRLLPTPGFLLGVLLLSVLAMVVEAIGYWYIKQAFSSPLQDLVLMKDMPFAQFSIVVGVAGITRIIPYTFASFGVYEFVSVIMFWVFGQGFLSGTTVTILESVLLNTVTFVFFVVATRVSASPSILETWRMFYRRSAVGGSLSAPQ